MEKENKSVKKNKKSSAFILFLLIFMLLVLYLIYNIGLNFKPVTIIEYEGYAVSGKELVENLLKSDLNAMPYIEAIKIDEDSAIYKKIATYFVGEDKKTKINLDYPIYINQNIALLDLSEDSKLITTNFEEVSGYKNSALTDGGLYNNNNKLERADYNDYLFLKNSDNIYINSKEIKIETNVNTYVIPTNSMITFSEEYIAYYYLSNGTFKYRPIVDVDLDSKVSIDTISYIMDAENGEMNIESIIKEYTYKEFLTNLNLIRKPLLTNVEEEEIPEEEPVIEEEPEKEEEVKPEEETPEIEWVKPNVTATNFETSVYTASTQLSIYDPSGAIKTAITFEIYKNGKVYMRNQAISSGTLRIGILEPNTEYEIRGIYRYSDAEDKTIETQFISQTIKTKDISELKPIKLSFTNENIYSNKIELTNLKIDSDFNEITETIIGIKNAEIVLNGKAYTFSTSSLRKLLNGQTITYTTQDVLESNTEVDFEIRMYDVANNLVKLENNTGKTNTCMQAPEMVLEKINKKVGIDVSLRAKLKNPDNVEVKNMRYVVYSIDNEIVDEGEITGDIIKPNNLELSKYYTVKVYGDYDIKDNRGEIKNNLLGEISIATASMDSFGDLYLDLEINDYNIKQDSVILNVNINTSKNKTNLELIQMLEYINISVYEDNELIQINRIEGKEFNQLTNLETVAIVLDKLNSNTSYKIQIDGRLELGSTSKGITAIINGPKTFTTLKEEAQINIKNLFILKDTIDFDINIWDKDEAVRTSKVTLEVISTRNEIVQRYELATSKLADEYTRIQVTGLEPEEKYYLSINADRYSIRQEEATIKQKYFEFNGNEKRISNTIRNDKNVGVISTNNVGGTIELESMQRVTSEDNINLVDMESNVNWYSECFNTSRSYLKEFDTTTQILKIGVGNSTSQIYIYDLKTSVDLDKFQDLEISFKYKRSNSNLKIYLQNGMSFSEDKILEVTSQNSSLGSDGWYVFDSKDISTEISTSQYLGFLLDGSKNSYMEIKELQVNFKEDENDESTEGDSTQSQEGYSPFTFYFTSKFNLNLNLYDEKLAEIGYNTNVTNGKYYIRIKDVENNKITDTLYSNYVQQAKEDKGLNNNAIENLISALELEQGKKYKVMLILKHPNLEEREYILSEIDVDTSLKEIKNISNISEYLKIQPNGSYIFSNNINLSTGDYRFGNENLYFNGVLDFNGKTINREIELKDDTDYKYHLFYGLSENATIKNLVFDFKVNLRNAEGRTDVSIADENTGLVYKNQGTISNIIVKLLSSTNSPNRKFSIIGYENQGTLENFVIYLKSDFYLGGAGALGFVNCNGGTIKNGYITPYPNTTYGIKPIECLESNIPIAGLVSTVTNNSTINNVYSLVNIKNEDTEDNVGASFYAGNVIAKITNSTVKNIYSVGIGNITMNNSKNATIGPTISYPYNMDDKNTVVNSYFFYEENMNNNNYNTKVNIAALSNKEFQEQFLNSDESEKKFIIDSTIKEYFPTIELPEVMPAQFKIPMVKTSTTEADILMVDTLEDGDLEKIVEFTIFNPREAKIDKIEIQGLEVDPYRIHSDDYCTADNPFEKCKGHDEEGYCLDASGNRILVESDGYTQNYLSGQTTKLITKVRIPSEETLDANGFDSRTYSSSYCLKSLRAKGYEEKVYIEDDGTELIRNEIELTYYFQITDVQKWKRINQYPDENYRLVANLDFGNTPYTDYCITNVFKGVLTGEYQEDSQTKIAQISNIGKKGTESKLPLFYKIDYAKISNLMINGFVQLIDTKNVSENAYISGLIGVTTKGTEIENIHIKNARITTKASSSNYDTFYISGLVAKATGTTIKNCSVTYVETVDNAPNITDYEENRLSTASIGGLVAMTSNTKILNCFVRNALITMKVGTSDGIGGLVGRFSGEIRNCYATGQVKTNTQNIGGIFGKSLEAANICQDCYAAVNIKTDSISLGGIGGFANTSSASKIINNVSIGNLYTSTVGSNVNLNRIVGNITSTTYTNYGYKNQLINGFKVSEKDSNYKRGAKYVVDKDEMIHNYNYMFNDDYYLEEDLLEEYLPRLKYAESDELLPNQDERQKLPENPTLEITSAKEVDGQIELQIKDENTPNVPTENIDLEIANFEGVTIQSREYDESTKTHTLYVTGTPIYYLDSYEISKIKYIANDGESYSAEISVKVDYLQYKEISCAEEWAQEFCPEYTGYRYQQVKDDGKPEFLSGQNYKITGDIKLSDIPTLNGETLTVPMKLEIGRLIGEDNSKENGRPLIYDYSITTKGSNIGIFSSITKELRDIDFKDIYIKNTSGNYTGIISICTAQVIENMDFTNITIEAASNYVGMIADNTCNNINNIKLTNIECRGAAYIGGFIGRSYPGTITNISADTIKLYATSNYCGGVFGYINTYTSSYGSNIKDFTVKNVYIESKANYVGGIVGYGFIRDNATLENIEIALAKGYTGGAVGQLHSVSPSNLTMKDIKINSTGGSFVGGAVGYNGGTPNNVFIYGLSITASGVTYVGGISGFGGAAYNSAIEGYVKDDGTPYNIISASSSSRVGGICGYTWGTIDRTYIRNVNITGGQYTGGLLGWGITCSIKNSYNQGCEVTGTQYVGGIMGGLTPDNAVRRHALEISNSYTDAKVTATTDTAGGILGYLDNSKMNNQTYVSKIFNNYVAASEVTAPTNAGSFIGKIVNPLYYLNDQTKYYYGNLIITNIDENYPIGNIDSITETYIVTEETEDGVEEIKVTRKVYPEETISRLFNSIFYKYNVENGKKVLESSKLEILKQESTYKDTLVFGNNNVNFNYSSSVISTMYPLIKNTATKTITYSDGTEKVFEQKGILLPDVQTQEITEETTEVQSLMSLYVRNSLPIYTVYASDVNKINIEFNEVPANTYFKYSYNGETSEAITLEKRVYTFEYDFDTQFEIILGNNSGEESTIFSPEDIAKRVSIINENYYYIQNNTLKQNLDTIDGTFVNIFNDKALTDEGYIYDIKTDSTGSIKTDGLKLLNETVPLAESVYSGNIIETYYRFSNIVTQDSQNITEYQMFLKNGRLFVLDGALDIYADSIIIDAYNNNEYQTVLGTDGVIYDLKEKINYPENFVNENIVQMTNNINSDTHAILIIYEDGRVYAFNYINGSVLLDTNEEETSLLENVANMVTSLFSLNRTSLYDPEEEEYQSAVELQEKLTETSIEEAKALLPEENVETENVEINNSTEENTTSNSEDSSDNNIVENENTTSGSEQNSESNSNSNSNSTDGNSSSTSSTIGNDNDSYVTVYDSDSNQYLVYKTSELMNSNSEQQEEVISETEKINLDPALKEFYETANANKASNQTNGIYYIILSIVTIGVILIIMYKKKNYA